MRRWYLLVLGLLVVMLFASGQHRYAFHYSRAAGQDLEINLCNTAAKESSYTIQIYDPWGKLLWEGNGTLQPYDAVYYLVSNCVPEEKETNWGVVIVDSQEPLVLGLEYYVKGAVHSVDVVDTEIPAPEAKAVFRTVSYYSQIPQAFTAIVLMNPWNQAVSGRLVVYQSDGSIANQMDFTLKAYEANSYSLAKLVGEGSKLWGLVEVLTNDGPVVLTCKFVISGIVHVQNMVGAQRVGTSAPSTTTPPPPKKE